MRRRRRRLRPFFISPIHNISTWICIVFSSITNLRHHTTLTCLLYNFYSFRFGHCFLWYYPFRLLIFLSVNICKKNFIYLIRDTFVWFVHDFSESFILFSYVSNLYQQAFNYGKRKLCRLDIIVLEIGFGLLRQILNCIHLVRCSCVSLFTEVWIDWAWAECPPWDILLYIRYRC